MSRMHTPMSRQLFSTPAIAVAALATGVLLVGTIAAPSKAATISIYEGFDYIDASSGYWTSVTGQAPSGTGLSGTWDDVGPSWSVPNSSNPSFDAISTATPDGYNLSTVGARALKGLGSGTRAHVASITTGQQIDTAQDGVYYLSYLVKADAGDNETYVKVGTGGWQVRFNPSDGFAIGTSDSNLSARNTLGYTTSQRSSAPYLIVSKYQANASAPDVVSLAAYLVGTDTVGQAPTTWDMSYSAASSTTLDTLYFGRDSDDILASMDEIRVGSTWADVTGVVPEPATAALLGLGMGLIFTRRRVRPLT